VRVRCAVAFTVLLLALSAVPVLAADSPLPAAPAPAEPPPVELPGLEDVNEGIAIAEREEAERLRWLESPEAVRLREESRYAFADLTSAESHELLLSTFAEQLEKLDTDPARFLSDAQLIRPLGEDEDAATVKAEGDGSLLDASIPVRTEDESGELKKVDLSLEPVAGGFEALNPLVEVRIPASADESVQIGSEGMAVSAPEAVGTSTAQLLDDKSAFYPEALGPDSDVDRLIAPISGGVEIFDLLRSVESPETLHFRIDVPEGAELRPDSYGGAEVLRKEERIASIPRPYAVDAQGSSVPVEMGVESDQLILHVAHREADVAYPLLVDPAIFEDWINPGLRWIDGGGLPSLTNGSWKYEETHEWIASSTSCIYACWGGSGRGLFVSMPSGTHWGQQFGEWIYRAPNANSYLVNAWANPFARNDHGCHRSQHPQPHDYVGMWNQGKWNRFLNNQAADVGAVDIQSWGEAFILGLHTGGSGGTFKMPCWRDLYVGGVVVWLDDWQYPHVSSVTGVPTGWLKKDATSRTINVSAADSGLGVQNVRMFGVGSNEWFWNQPGCTGLYANRCPNYKEGQITFKTESFPYEGEVKFSVQAIDPTDKRWALERTLKVDGTSPTIDVSGQLAKATKEIEGDKQDPTAWDELSLPTYNLEIKAKDGSPTELRSGVKEISVYLDGKATPEATKSLPSCSAGSCPLMLNYKLKLPGLSEGKHTLKVVAVDFAGNVVNPERKIEFEYIPATGMKEEYVLQHFRLPDGQDHSEEAEYHGPEIAVNVMNGNVVYHERDFDIHTDRASLELERFYNSQLPVEKDTQWGHGWTLAQTPELKPEQSESPQKGTMMRTSAITGSVNIPESPSQPTFSSRLHATIKKTSSGGYEVSYEDGAEVSVFSANGRIEETRFGDSSPAGLGESVSPASKPAYESFLGTSGTGNGQLNKPSDAAIDAAGNVWIADRQNNRIQKFSSNGEYLAQFGSYGSADGQLFAPTALAIDAQGNIWVADGGNRRVQKFNSKGEFLLKFGSQGTGNGQFSSYGPRGIAIDAQGNIWVSDYSSRIQKFNSAGGFVKVVGSGTFGESAGLDAGGGKIWVGDWTKNRLSVFSEAGDHLFNAGASGAGPGQFSHPDAVEVDAHGNVWVGDEGNARVQQLDQQGKYVNQFGAAGSGAGQFKFAWPYGLTSDEAGRIWIADSSNHRVQHWQIPDWIPSGGLPYYSAPIVDYDYSATNLIGMTLEDPAEEDEPSLDVNLTSGLVSSVDDEEAGTTLYGYESGRLTAKVDEKGQTKFINDSSGRLKRVELPNGTWAEISYDSTSRATKVTVDPAGAEGAKSTNFWYGEEPRETIVWGGGNPEIVYSIGEDGSVFKWSYADVPPAIDSISGSLWGKRNETQAIENKDHTLFVTGSSPHQIASIKVIANGDALVEEKTCEDPAEPPSHICEKPEPLEWITHASEHAAGRLDLEVVVTDFFGRSTAERFFVTVPQQPPPDPEAPERPTSDSIKLFREEYGLDRNNPLTESQMNRLILELLYEWERRDPTAMAAVESWGVPMRASELAEMEWRRAYSNKAAEVIPQWAEEHAPSTYGGFYVDEKAGGIIHVGFTTNQQASVEALKQDPRLLSPGQIKEFPTPPVNSVMGLEATAPTVTDALVNDLTMRQLAVSVRVAPAGNVIQVGATEPGPVKAFLATHFGVNAPIAVYMQEPNLLSASRYTTSGPVVAGSALIGENANTCTAGYGSRAYAGQERGRAQYRYFTLTAGHCYPLNLKVGRQIGKFKGGILLGKVRRNAYSGLKVTDAAGILINDSFRSHSVLNGSPLAAEPIQGAEKVRVGRTVCWSGIYGGKRCGKVLYHTETLIEGAVHAVYVANDINIEGDSGGPVWDPVTHKAVGLITGLPGELSAKCWETSFDTIGCNQMLFTPLLQGGGSPGILPKLGVEVLKQD